MARRILTPAPSPLDTDPVERAVLAAAGTADRAVGALAGRNHGLITRRQLGLAGLDPAAIRRRAAGGTLHRYNAAVLAVGYEAQTFEARLLSSVWAYSESRAAVGYASAAGAWQLQRRTRGPVHVIAPVGSRRPGTRLHRVPLFPGDVRLLRGVPVTSPGRTLADQATAVRRDALERLVHEAQVLDLLCAGELERARRRSLRRRGGAALRELLEEIDPDLRVRSELERRFASLVAAAASDFPRPVYNVLVEVPGLRMEVDVAWLELGVVVELDGGRYHRTTVARRRDARRDSSLRAAGMRIERVEWADLGDPGRLLARVDPRSGRSQPGSGMKSLARGV